MSRPAAAALHLIGLFVSGSGIKKCTSKHFPSYIIWISVVIELLGILIYSHPASSNKLRNVADKSIDIFLKTAYLPMATCEILLLANVDDIILAVYIFISLLIFVIHATKNIRDKFLDVAVVVECAVALAVLHHGSRLYDNYWLLHLVFLFLLNHLLLPRISKRFSVPQIELSIVSLNFLNLFLINSFS